MQGDVFNRVCCVQNLHTFVGGSLVVDQDIIYPLQLCNGQIACLLVVMATPFNLVASHIITIHECGKNLFFYQLSLHMKVFFINFNTNLSITDNTNCLLLHTMRKNPHYAHRRLN